MAVAAALLFSLAVAAAMSVGLDRLLPKDQLFVPYFTTWHAVAVPENTRDFFQGEPALSTHIIESRPAGYSKEQVGDPRRRFALPVLFTGAFLPVLDFNVASLAPAGHSRRSRRKFERSAVRHLGLCRDLRGVSDHGWRARRPLRWRRTFLWGVAGFTIASLLCGFAWSPGILVGGRVLQGFAATMLAPQVLASIRALFPTRWTRTRARLL
jgi:hypothetical protein